MRISARQSPEQSLEAPCGRGQPRTWWHPAPRIILSLAAAILLARCAPPTGVVDVAALGPATQLAMQRVPVSGPGQRISGELGSVGPVSGYGCGTSPAAARASALQQLRIKTLQLRATAVENAVTEPASAVLCSGSYAVIAHGIAVAPRGVPPTY